MRSGCDYQACKYFAFETMIRLLAGDGPAWEEDDASWRKGAIECLSYRIEQGEMRPVRAYVNPRSAIRMLCVHFMAALAGDLVAGQVNMELQRPEMEMHLTSMMSQRAW